MEFSGTLAGGLSGSMHFGSDGDTVDIDPIVTSGTKIATFTVNAGTEEEVSYDLYTPDTLSWDDITDKPTLFSGVYGDLSSKPTLDGNVINGNMFTHNYSTSERRVGTWIDGKPLYEKTFTFITDSNIYYIPNTTYIKHLINISGYANKENYDFYIPYSDGTDDISIAYIETNGIRIFTTNYFNGAEYILNVQYTKSSDYS